MGIVDETTKSVLQSRILRSELHSDESRNWRGEHFPGSIDAEWGWGKADEPGCHQNGDGRQDYGNKGDADDN